MNTIRTLAILVGIFSTASAFAAEWTCGTVNVHTDVSAPKAFQTEYRLILQPSGPRVAMVAVGERVEDAMRALVSGSSICVKGTFLKNTNPFVSVYDLKAD